MGFHGDVVVDKHAAAVFANDDFFVHFDFALTLGRYFAEAAAAGIAVDGDDGKAVTGLLADAFVGGEVMFVDEFFLFGGFVAEADFVFFGFLDNAVEFAFFGVEFGLAFFDKEMGCVDVLFEFLDFAVGVAVATFAELDFEVLIFDFLVDGFEFAVVAHVVLLFLVLLDHGLVVGDFAVALSDGGVLFSDVLFEVVDTSLEAGDFVLEVLDGLGEFATDDLDFVDFGVDKLKGVEGDKAAFGGDVDVRHLIDGLCGIEFGGFGWCDFLGHCDKDII